MFDRENLCGNLLSGLEATLGSAADQIDRCAQDRALGKVGQRRGNGGDDDRHTVFSFP